MNKLKLIEAIKRRQRMVEELDEHNKKRELFKTAVRNAEEDLVGLMQEDELGYRTLVFDGQMYCLDGDGNLCARESYVIVLDDGQEQGH